MTAEGRSVHRLAFLDLIRALARSHHPLPLPPWMMAVFLCALALLTLMNLPLMALRPMPAGFFAAVFTAAAFLAAFLAAGFLTTPFRAAFFGALFLAMRNDLPKSYNTLAPAEHDLQQPIQV